MSNPAKTILISAKCSDMFMASLLDAEGNELISNNGYVPDFFPGEHYGDYVMLNIDLATGQIMNWKTPSAAALKKWMTGS
jgi:hypothetical protein